MKKLIILFVSIVTFQAFASDPLPPVGLFKFDQAMTLLQVKKTEMVDARMPTGAARVKTLISEGWACVAKTNNTFKCDVFPKDEVLPVEFKNEITQEYFGYSMEFSEAFTVGLINQGEINFEYLVSQKVVLNGKEIDQYKLYVVRDSPAKLTFDFAKGKPLVYFNILNDVAIDTLVFKKKIQNNLTTQYMVQVILQK